MPTQSDYDYLRSQTAKSILDQFGNINYQDILNEYTNPNSGVFRVGTGTEDQLGRQFRSNILGRDVQVSDLGDGQGYSFNFTGDGNRDGYTTVLRQGQNGVTNLFETERGNEWDFLKDMAMFAAAATGMYGGINALAGAAGATGTASTTALPQGGMAATGTAAPWAPTTANALGSGTFGTGVADVGALMGTSGGAFPLGSGLAGITAADLAVTPGLLQGLTTGNRVLDKVIEKGLTRAGTSAITSALTGGAASGGTRNTGGGSTGSGNDGGWGMSGLLSGLVQNYVANNTADRITDVSNTSANTINQLAGNLAGQGTFTPYNITSGVGSTTTDANGNMTSTLSDAWQGIQSAAQGQIPALLQPYQNAAVSGISGDAYAKSREWLQKTANPLYAQNETLGLQGAGNLLGLAGRFDPEAAARKEYDLMQQIYAPTREADNLNMENRLRSQGRLGLNYGSIGAAPELAALAYAARMQDLNATKDSRALAFDRQNQIINQANTMNQMGIQSGAAGLNQQKGIYDIANGLFGMGMSGDRFMEDMNVSRTNRANALQNMAMQPENFLQNQQAQAITAGGARSTAAQNAARLQADLGLQAERIRNQGAMGAAAIRADRDANLLRAITGQGGSGGLLSGGGVLNNAVSGMLSQAASSGVDVLKGVVGQLLNSGVEVGDLQSIMEQAGVDIDQYLEYGEELDMDSLLDWANSGDFGETTSGVIDDITDWMEW